MRFAQFTLLLVACLNLWGTAPSAQKIGEVPRFEPSEKAEVGAVLEWTTPEGQEYWYRLPKQKRGKAKPALILMLHGTGLDHGWSFWNYPIAAGNFRGDDIVVSPDGLTPGNGDKFNFSQNKKDGEQISNLIALFRKRFDVGNVYLYGHSQGAFFCYWFAGEHPELIDGIVAHAGNLMSNVQHPKLAKSKVAIGILHARSDPVVSVVCAENTERFYKEAEYQKLKCWIVEGIREQAGHWPLPDHVGTMFEWLDSVSTSSPRQDVAVAVSALAKDVPDLALATRAVLEARARLPKYKADDAAVVAERIQLLEGLLDELVTIGVGTIERESEVHGNGKLLGAYAADVRHMRRELGKVPSCKPALKPLASALKKHDKALAKLAKSKNREKKKYAKALLAALENGWLGEDFDLILADARRRVEAGWAPLPGLASSLADIAAKAGEKPAEKLTGALGDRVTAFLAEHPELQD